MVLLKNILITGAIGSLVFTLLVILFAYSGLAAEIRDEYGQFRRRMSLKAILGVLVFISFLLGLLVTSNILLSNRMEQSPEFSELWINSFGVFMFVHIYDLVVLDYLIIVKWHPAFLKLPETAYYKTIKPHVYGFFRGIPFGMVLSLVVSLAFSTAPF